MASGWPAVVPSPWSGMNLCNVIQNYFVDEKDRFCIVGLYLDDTEPKLGYTC